MFDPLRPTPFGPTSRYFGLPTATFQHVDGRKLVYLRRRFVPPPDAFDLLLEHLVAERERLDTIAARYLDDPEQFWRICDGNNAIDPNALTDQVGRRLRITLPEGIPGQRHV